VCTLQILLHLPAHLATAVLQRGPKLCIRERVKLTHNPSLCASVVAALFPSILSRKSLTLNCVRSGEDDSHQRLGAACTEAALTHLRFSSDSCVEVFPLKALQRQQLRSLQALELHRILLPWVTLAGLGQLFTGSLSCSLQALRL
jgi:hypothetical protein